MVNSGDLVNHLSRRFDVHKLSFDDHSVSREGHVNNMLSQMAQTNILVGFHGAGLAHTAYLQPESIVVEIKDDSNRNKKLFQNMANLQNIGYYLFDAVKAYSKAGGTKLSELEMIQFTDDLWYVWQQEKEVYLERTSASRTGECEFPEYIIGNHSKLSTFEQSQCYLEIINGTHDKWAQCTTFGDHKWYFNNGIDRGNKIYSWKGSVVSRH